MPFHPYYTIKDSVGLCVFLMVFALPRVLRAELSRRSGQLHPGQSAADADRDRARMVLPAVLRDPALGPGQAAAASRCMFGSIAGAVRAALARHLAGAQRPLPPDLPLADDAAAWSTWSSLGMVGAHRPEGLWVLIGRVCTDVLLPPLPRAAAVPRQARAAAAAAREHQPPRPAAAPAAAGARCRRRRLPSRWRRPDAPPRDRRLLAARCSAARRALRASLGAGGHAAPPPQNWSFNGTFGTFDRASLQRGFQVYKEVCSTCHSMKQLSYRNLQGIGLTADQVRPIAASVHGAGRRGRPAASPSSAPALPSDRSARPSRTTRRPAPPTTARCRPTSR